MRTTGANLMQAVRLHEYGDPVVLPYEDLQVPVPAGFGQVGIRSRRRRTSMNSGWQQRLNVLATGHRPRCGV
jgi:hypothetical protein